MKQNNEMLHASHQEETRLVEGCLRGDQQAQRKLFESFYGKMLGVCQRYTRDREEAKDILQDGFVKVFQKLDQYNFTSTLEAWVRRIMVNTAIDRYRKNISEPTPTDLEPAYTVSEDYDVISEMNHAELLECLQRLPAGYRLVFNMFVIEGFSHKEIAESLRITEGTSKSQLSKAKAYLQKLIPKHFTTHG